MYQDFQTNIALGGIYTKECPFPNERSRARAFEKVERD